MISSGIAWCSIVIYFPELLDTTKLILSDSGNTKNPFGKSSDFVRGIYRPQMKHGALPMMIQSVKISQHLWGKKMYLRRISLFVTELKKQTVVQFYLCLRPDLDIWTNIFNTGRGIFQSISLRNHLCAYFTIIAKHINYKQKLQELGQRGHVSSSHWSDVSKATPVAPKRCF